MKKEPLEERIEAPEIENEKQPSKEKQSQKGNGVTLGFQIVLACLLIAAAVLLKTNFTPEYEEVRRRYYVLLNEEISFGNLGKYISNLFQAGDGQTPPDPNSFAISSEIISLPPVSEENEDSASASKPIESSGEAEGEREHADGLPETAESDGIQE